MLFAVEDDANMVLTHKHTAEWILWAFDRSGKGRELNCVVEENANSPALIYISNILRTTTKGEKTASESSQINR